MRLLGKRVSAPGGEGASCALIVVVVGFWQQQVDDLMTGIGGLGGLPPLDTPTLEPYPYPSPMPTPVPQYPPYIPEQQMPTSSGMPRSTLDGIHDDGGVIIKPPGELGPPNYPNGPRYTESPEGSGVWVPDHRPLPPGSVRPAGWDGKGADQADTADAALRRTHDALNEADQGLAQHIIDAHTADTQTKTQLQRIQQEIQQGVAAMQPTLGTASGREQLAEFLDRKASEAKQVASNAQEKAARLASNFQTVGQQFEAAGGPNWGDPWTDDDDEWVQPIDPGGAAAGPGAGPAIPPSIL
ncbi:DUF4226 domain-containing protein [Mycobacterium eburneum]|nr:DUF4226 domain-containing protein [Mycobacterium eburneum]